MVALPTRPTSRQLMLPGRLGWEPASEFTGQSGSLLASPPSCTHSTCKAMGGPLCSMAFKWTRWLTSASHGVGLVSGVLSQRYKPLRKTEPGRLLLLILSALFIAACDGPSRLGSPCGGGQYAEAHVILPDTGINAGDTL